MVKVILLQEGITSYRVPFYKKLSQQKGIDFTLVCSSFSTKLKAESFENADPAGGFKTYMLPIPTERTFQYWFELVRYIRRAKPDIVITGLWMSSLYLLGFIKPLFGYKLILWSGGVPYLDEDRVRKEALAMDRRKLLVKPFRLFLNRCDALVLYSEHSKDFYSRFFGFERPQMFVAPNSPDTDVLFDVKAYHEQHLEEMTAARKKLLPESNKVILTLGRLNKGRRMDLLLDVMKDVQDEFANVGLMIIGDGSEREWCERCVEKSGLRNVLFLGAIYGDREIAGYLRMAEVFIYTGVASLAVKVAMSMGVPVVGFDHGLEVHAIEDGISGFVVPFGNTKAMSEKVLMLLRDEKLQERVGEQGFQIMRDRINLAAMVDGFVQAILLCKRGLKTTASHG